MIIIGVDFHPEFQQIALVDTDTGEFQEKRLAHREDAETFYRALAGQRVRVGMEASGHARWFERLVAELQFELWIGDAAEIRTQQNNRAHAAAASQALPVLVVKEMQRHQKYLEQRMTRLRRAARQLIACDPELDRCFRLMLTTTGIAEPSVLQILGELAVLPDMLDARQWVAFSGLDPRLFKSGKSIEKRPRISRGGSRHLRRALYMPALVALRRDPYLRGFYQNLLARGKARLQAVVAVMRKLLHALFAMFRTNQPYGGSKLCAVDLAVCAVAA